MQKKRIKKVESPNVWCILFGGFQYIRMYMYVGSVGLDVAKKALTIHPSICLGPFLLAPTLCAFNRCVVLFFGRQGRGVLCSATLCYALLCFAGGTVWFVGVFGVVVGLGFLGTRAREWNYELDLLWVLFVFTRCGLGRGV